jgi:hypothetical protein
MPKYMWPFLISCNKEVDYQPIIAPDFMVDAKKSGLLMRWAKFDNDLSGNIREVAIPTSDWGKITLLYRVTMAKKEQTPYRDSSGRPILWIEGVVVKGDIKKDDMLYNHLKRTFYFLEEEFTSFWTGQAKLKPSSPISVQVQGNNGSKPKFMVAIMFSTLFVILIPLLVILLLMFFLGLPLGITLPPFGLILILFIGDIVLAIVTIKTATSEYRKLK